MMEFRIVHDEAARRYRAVDGQAVAGFIEYRQRGGELALTHTVVDPLFEGRGVGSALVAHALAEARRQGWGVLPYCPFVLAYLIKRPELIELVPPERRADFGLALAQSQTTAIPTEEP
ncbi:MAG: N-acetyltransferase [Propionibacteriaceae bacterium]|jgi:predicted GNAT family acetyltransferase|nr:N-acetyltransferase [Propionibacteriaceae bacterium]